MSSDDRIEIRELINLHGHLMDEGEFGRLEELFTADVVYDLSAYGDGKLVGINAVVEAGRDLGSANPIGHHVTNVIVTHLADDVAHVRSKGLAVMSGGTTGSVVYDDVLHRTEHGWRIARRSVLPRRAPLQPSR